MEVFIPVYLAPNAQLRMRDPSCQLQNNRTHYVISFSYDECGTSKTSYASFMNVENEISVSVILNNPGFIEFAPDYTIPLRCSVSLKNSVDGAFQAVDRDHYNFGNSLSADFKMKEFSSELYQDEITQYPVKVPINREIFFELSLASGGGSSGISVEKCEATPTANPNHTTHLSLVSNGCSSSPAVKILPRPGLELFRFSVQIFHFSAPVNENNLVYVHCYVNLCQASKCNTACGVNKRRRRSLSPKYVVTLTSGIHVITAE